MDRISDNASVRPRRAIIALAAIAVLGATAPERAQAGLYTAVQCDRGHAAGARDARFASNSRDFRFAVACRRGGRGIEVRHRRSPTVGGRTGAWTIAAPAGTEVVRGAARVSGAGGGGIVPELLAGTPSTLHPVGPVRGAPHHAGWRGPGSMLVARLRCTHSERCRPRGRPHVRVKRVRLRIRDLQRPTLALGGSLLDPGVRRGSLGLQVAASDVGSGVRHVTVEVNGLAAADHSFRCALDGRVARRVQPCPASATTTLALNTASAPFRQGPNQVRVCAWDLATSGPANAGCEVRTLRVDNACPVSAVAGGTALHVRIAGTRSGNLAARGDRPAVVGRLTGAGGAVRGARVCVAARVEVAGALERVLATPLTNRNGHFRVALRRGPNRSVRVAYWPDANAAIERFARLRVRARPRLVLRPRGGIRNGHRLRFSVELPGPANARRLVKVQARAHGRWVPVSTGRTGPRGVYRSGYRFRATTGRRTYRFRALVPSQPGYPYAPGASAVKRKTVRGRA